MMINRSSRGPELRFGADVKVVKLRPDGEEAATYNGTLVESPPGWVVIRATWTFKRMELGYMTFEPDDYLVEYFATSQPFNAFALFAPDNEFKGWYCNITHPTTVDGRTIYWQDLYVDVVQQADGKLLVLDEDELAESGMERKDPALHSMIMDARNSVVEKMRTRSYPFSEYAAPAG
jgi:protein associated with RNAse G/E